MVFNGSLAQSWAFGDTLNITLSTPFTYNPSNGNLLLDVVGSGLSTPDNIFFDVNSTSGELSRDYCPGGLACASGTVDSNYGLVTGFTTTATAVPEPLTLSIFGAGLAGVAAMRRRTKKASA